MKSALLRLLSHDWGGLAMAAIVGALGLLCTSIASSTAGRAVGAGLLLVSAVAALCSLRHIVTMARIRARYPAPGRRVDIGGFSIHLLAEGEARGRPAVVWMPGAHTAGFAFHHLHRRWREEGRSILIDRPGTGWSDAGTFPRRTAKEAVEIVRALDEAGEIGPFIFAGHSFGGLLVANIARRFPERVAAVVLLDATPLETIVFGPPTAAPGAMSREAFMEAIRRAFGFVRDPIEQQRRAYPGASAVLDQMMAVLGPDVLPMRAVERGARAMCAAASIYEELTPEGAGRVGWDTSVYDGDLEGLRVLLVAPRDAKELESQGPSGADEAARIAARTLRFYSRTRERYLATSSRAQRIYSPPGTGHNFPYEAPEFVIEVIRTAAAASAS